MINDDLSTLFGGSSQGLRYRQGTILTWDADTGANTVDMAGATLTNLKVFNSGEAIRLKPGHIVGLWGQGNSWVILGRFAGFGDPDYASASVAFASVTGFQQNFAVPAANTIRASTNIPVPAWADEAAVMCFATATIVNSTASRQMVLVSAGLNGGGGAQLATGVGPDAAGFGIANLSASHSLVISSPGATINVNCQIETTAAFAANTINTATVTAMAVFRSTV